MNTEKITMLQGSGGAATAALIDEIFAGAFSNPVLDAMEDAAVVPTPAAGAIALTTDSFVVTPPVFRGGDIGRLSICGTVNDLLMRGAVPKYITCGFILEEGLEVSLLKKVVSSMAETAKEAGVTIVAGDTKVVEGHGELYINTAGVGFVETDISAKNAAPGDAILVSGTMGDHHAAILSERMAIETDIASDNAPLVEIVRNLLSAGLHVHVLRDITRGGLGTVLNELAEASDVTFEIEEEAIPVSPKVRDFCGLLGLDPLYMGNEGKLVCILPEEEVETAINIMHSSRYGEKAAKIGRVVESGQRGQLCPSLAGAQDVQNSPHVPPVGAQDVQNSPHVPPAEASGDGPRVIARTAIGGRRIVGVLEGEGLPRIC